MSDGEGRSDGAGPSRARLKAGAAEDVALSPDARLALQLQVRLLYDAHVFAVRATASSDTRLFPLSV